MVATEYRPHRLLRLVNVLLKLRPCRLDPDLASGPGSGSGRLVRLLLEFQTDVFSSPKSQSYIRTAAMAQCPFSRSILLCLPLLIVWIRVWNSRLPRPVSFVTRKSYFHQSTNVLCLRPTLLNATRFRIRTRLTSGCASSLVGRQLCSQICNNSKARNIREAWTSKSHEKSRKPKETREGPEEHPAPSAASPASPRPFPAVPPFLVCVKCLSCCCFDGVLRSSLSMLLMFWRAAFPDHRSVMCFMICFACSDFPDVHAN